MAQSRESRKIAAKKSLLLKALSGWRDLMSVDLSTLSNPIILDGIKNGQLQKFEYCSELLWKNLKLILRSEKGLDFNAPKDVYRGAFASQIITEELCQKALEMVDARNRLSHEYNEVIMRDIYPKLSHFLQVCSEIASTF